jgi:hypothetical protein
VKLKIITGLVLIFLAFDISAIAKDKPSIAQAKASLIRMLKTDSYSESSGTKKHIEDASFDGCILEFTSYSSSPYMKHALRITIPLNHISAQNLKVDGSDGETVKIILAIKNNQKKIIVKGEIKIGENVSEISNFVPETDMVFQDKKTANEILRLISIIMTGCKA